MSEPIDTAALQPSQLRWSHFEHGADIGISGEGATLAETFAAVATALTAIVNLQDKSYSVAPELLYTGVRNLELRARAIFLNGGAGTDFGEKQNERRIELQARLYF